MYKRININIGVIGYRNHSFKIIKFLNSLSFIERINVYCYKKNASINKIKSKKINYTFKINDLNNVDAVFITCPPKMHYYYLKKFINLNKYIFCEKPPVINNLQLKYINNLSNYKKKKIYFNFNFIFSNFFDILKKEISYKKNGELINITANSTHGLSFKKNYFDNWRESKKNITNISGNLGIHFIHFISKLIGLPDKINFLTSSFSKQSLYDTSVINLIFNKKISTNIFLSYSTVKSKNIILYFTNSIIEIQDKKILKYYPRDTFDKNNLFVTPKSKQIIKYKSMDGNSNEKSIDFFISKVIKKENFNLNDFNLACSVNNLYFKNK